MCLRKELIEEERVEKRMYKRGWGKDEDEKEYNYKRTIMRKHKEINVSSL